MKGKFFSSLHRASDDLVEYTLEMITDQAAGALLDEAARPPRLLYAEDHTTYTEVKTVELPGVRFKEPAYPERVWVRRECGVELPVADYDSRLWLEEMEDGQVFPVEMESVLKWARERIGR